MENACMNRSSNKQRDIPNLTFFVYLQNAPKKKNTLSLWPFGGCIFLEAAASMEYKREGQKIITRHRASPREPGKAHEIRSAI